jgi:hypothetical protein
MLKSQNFPRGGAWSSGAAVWLEVLEWAHAKESYKSNATATSEIYHLIQAGNQFPDYHAHTEETFVWLRSHTIWHGCDIST